MQNLGGVLRLLGKNERASKLIREGFDMISQILPRNQAMVATAYNNLAYDQKMAGGYKESEANYNDALDIRKTIFGDDHPETLVVMNNLAELYLAMNETEKATNYQQQMLAIIGYKEDKPEDEAASNEKFDIVSRHRT